MYRYDASEGRGGARSVRGFVEAETRSMLRGTAGRAMESDLATARYPATHVLHLGKRMDTSETVTQTFARQSTFLRE